MRLSSNILRLSAFFLFIIILNMPIMPQSADSQARALYQEAVTENNQGNYSRVIILCKEIIRSLGSTNLRIQPLLANALFQVKDYVQAEKAIDVYFQLNPPADMAVTSDMRSLLGQIKNALINEQKEYEAAVKQNTIALYNNYLASYPYGRYRGIIEEKLFDSGDNEAYSSAVSKRNSAAYWEYLRNYPNGRHADEARATVKRWDEEAYKKAVQSANENAYAYYLQYYPEGQFRFEIAEKLRVLKEDNAFRAAVSSTGPEGLRNFIKQYPNSRHTESALDILNRMDNRAYNVALKGESLDAYNQYLKQFPDGQYAVEIEQLKKEKTYSFHIDKGNYYLEVKWPEDAKNHFNAALSIKPGDPAARAGIKKAERMERQKQFRLSIKRGFNSGPLVVITGLVIAALFLLIPF